MSQSLREIKNRIKGIENTSKVTSAMELISVSKLNTTDKRLQALRPYHEAMRSLVQTLAAQEGVAQHPLQEQRPAVRSTVLCVITSDNGLCASYNMDVLRLAHAFISGRGKEQVKVLVVGKRGLSFFKRKAIPVIHAYQGIHGRFDSVISDEIAGILMNLFLSRRVDEAHVAYMYFKKGLVQDPIVEKFLNLELPAAPASGAPVFEPDAATIAGKLIPQYCLCAMRRIFLEAFTSEHAARSMAMHTATDNAKDLLKTLRVQSNKVRQSIITQEIMEIISSAEALRG